MIDLISYDDYKKLLESSHGAYYSGRWEYYKEVIQIILNKQYDLLIALQVWEHLDNKQTRAFRELKRVAKRAILSFPYEWTGGEQKPSHRAHRDIDKALISDWTLNIPPREIIEIPRTSPGFSKGKRLIYYWVF